MPPAEAGGLMDNLLKPLVRSSVGPYSSVAAAVLLNVRVWTLLGLLLVDFARGRGGGAEITKQWDLSIINSNVTKYDLQQRLKPHVRSSICHVSSAAATVRYDHAYL